MNIELIFNDLKLYCESENFKGYDPYDGLNSKFFQLLPFFKNNSFCRLVWIQLFKKLPINLRSFVGIKKDYNPKGLGLFLLGYCNLYKITANEEYRKIIKELAEKIISLKSAGYSGACWGYNFDWQAKAFFQPHATPTVVASTFIGDALLEAYEILKDETILSEALSIKNFILHDLNKTYDSENDFAFSYSPLDKTQVFNASLLGSRILSKIYSYTKEEHLIMAAKKSVNYCCKHQHINGSWVYSPLTHHQWIDSFHTGYNLECIAEYQKYSGDFSFEKNIEKGLAFYLNNFFTENGVPKYYHNSIYPIDIHTTAQLIITLSKLHKFKENQSLVEKVLEWTINNMFSKKGYFYFQKTKFYTNKIPYIRWSQAWMFYGLTEYLKNTKR